MTAYLPLADLVDLAAERQRSTKELAETQAPIPQPVDCWRPVRPARARQRGAACSAKAWRVGDACVPSAWNGWRNWGKIDSAKAGARSQRDGFDLKLRNMTDVIEESADLRL